jgi:predicted RNA-binding protein YlxR (DUF448 family)
MKTKKVPLRTCVITKTQGLKKDLFRIVRDKEGNVFIDDTYKANGRGCYLLKDKSVIEKAKLGKVLDKHLNVKVDNSIYDELINKL